MLASKSIMPQQKYIGSELKAVYRLSSKLLTSARHVFYVKVLTELTITTLRFLDMLVRRVKS